MEGIFTAMVTPFIKDGSIDNEAFIRLLKQQQEARIDGIVIGGTTGEGWSLTDDDMTVLCDLAKEHFYGKVVLGTSDISTKGAVEKTLHAKKLGADAALVVVPFYNFPTEEGVVEHYKAVASGGLPVIVYHHPKRTGIKLSLSCLQKLCGIKGVVAIKETSGDEEYIRELSKDITIFSGDDLEMKKAKSLGARGVISVLSNIFPKKAKEFFATDSLTFPVSWEHFILELFKEGNPSGIKEALKEKKHCNNFVRLPLVPLTEHAKASLVKKMELLHYKEFANN